MWILGIESKSSDSGAGTFACHTVSWVLSHAGKHAFVPSAGFLDGQPPWDTAALSPLLSSADHKHSFPRSHASAANALEEILLDPQYLEAVLPSPGPGLHCSLSCWPCSGLSCCSEYLLSGGERCSTPLKLWAHSALLLAAWVILKSI